MANIKEKDLPVSGSITTSDYFRVVTGTGASEKASAAPILNAISALQAPTIITKEGCTVYRLGKFREAHLTNPSAWCATLASTDRPSETVTVMGKIYNGSAYVDCMIFVNSSGEVRVQDLFGGTISGAQYAYLRPRDLFYFVP